MKTSRRLALVAVPAAVVVAVPAVMQIQHK
jgi:hypothetical protein